MHVDTDLSAYLDGELAPADRTRVEAHLDGCGRCRARLGELRATVSLIAGLPSARPSRSLVPRVVERFNWVRPLRSFSTFASGAFLLVFLVTAIGRSGSGLGGGGAAMPFGAAPQGAPAAATAASAPERAAVATPQALPAAGGVADTTRTAVPAPDTALAQSSPQKAAEATAQPAPPRAETFGSPQADTSAREISRTPPPLTDPLIWLGLAVIAAVIAIGAHWRLRTT